MLEAQALPAEGNGAQPSSFMGMIVKDISGVTSELLGKVKQDVGKGANVSRVLAELFMWNWIAKHAESKYDKLLEKTKRDGVFGELSDLEPGDHALAESKHFFAMANVTEPVRRFSPDMLCQWAFQEHKIPVIVMKEQIDKAKAPTKSMVRIKIAERA
jgi:hypothetical protein